MNLIAIASIFLFFKSSLGDIKCISSTNYFDNNPITKSATIPKLFGSGQFVSEGSYGRIHLVSNVSTGNKKKNYFIRRTLTPRNKLEQYLLDQELNFMNKDSTFQIGVKTIDCVQTKLFTYIIQDTMFYDFDSAQTLLVFKTKSALERNKLYLLLIRYLKSLHSNFSVVHGNITPENIVAKQSDVVDLRLREFAFSAFANGKSAGEAPLFASPAKAKCSENCKTSVKDDIYSLAASIAVIETSYEEVFSNLSKDCLGKIHLDVCHTQICNNAKIGLEASQSKEFAAVILTAMQCISSNGENIVNKVTDAKAFESASSFETAFVPFATSTAQSPYPEFPISKEKMLPIKSAIDQGKVLYNSKDFEGAFTSEKMSLKNEIIADLSTIRLKKLSDDDAKSIDIYNKPEYEFEEEEKVAFDALLEKKTGSKRRIVKI